MRTVIVVACLLVPSVAAADAIGIPPCPIPGTRGEANPHHGTGWCAAAPCETDADCVSTGATSLSPDPGPRHCAQAGVCVWDGRLAIAACTTDGEHCEAAGYSRDSAICHVRKYCVPGAPPSAAPPSTSPVASPAPAGTPAHEPHGGLCSTSGRGAPLAALLLVALGVAATRRARLP